MSHKPSHFQKLNNLLEGWQLQYRKNQDKAQRATTYTRCSQPYHTTGKIKFKKVKFWRKEGHLSYNTEFKVYPDMLVFGESKKIFNQIKQKKSVLRDSDEISEADDIEHAIKKGIKKLRDEVTIRKMEKMIAKKQEKRERRQLKKSKIINKQEI